MAILAQANCIADDIPSANAPRSLKCSNILTCAGAIIRADAARIIITPPVTLMIIANLLVNMTLLIRKNNPT